MMSPTLRDADKKLRGYIKEKRIVMSRDDGRRVISEFTSILCGGGEEKKDPPCNGKIRRPN